MANYYHHRNTFNFSYAVLKIAADRQRGRCGCCGDKLDYSDAQAHHVIPAQIATRLKKVDSFFSSENNCLYLCHDCHFEYAHDGKWNGVVTSPQFFKKSHTIPSEHRKWAKIVNDKWDSLFPNAKK